MSIGNNPYIDELRRRKTELLKKLSATDFLDHQCRDSLRVELREIQAQLKASDVRPPGRREVLGR
jgi:hypothetical protein